MRLFHRLFASFIAINLTFFSFSFNLNIHSIYINIRIVFLIWSIDIHSLDLSLTNMNDSERTGLLAQLTNIQQGQVSSFDISVV